MGIPHTSPHLEKISGLALQGPRLAEAGSMLGALSQVGIPCPVMDGWAREEKRVGLYRGAGVA